MSWWAYLALAGGVLVLVAIALPAALDRERVRLREQGGVVFQPTDRTNYPTWNPWTFVALAGLLVLVVALSVGLAGS